MEGWRSGKKLPFKRTTVCNIVSLELDNNSPARSDRKDFVFSNSFAGKFCPLKDLGTIIKTRRVHDITYILVGVSLEILLLS